MVFQNYALYPHMTVAQEPRLRAQAAQDAEGGDRAARRRGGAACSGSRTLLDRQPAALSGGQRQRVAMGRAIVREPAAFLMDEPLSNLDAKLRVGMRAELARLHERLGVTTVYVTHDQVEAMTLGQRVAVMRDGVHPAGRHAAEALRPAAQPLRRRVHRLAVDEPVEAQRRRTASSSSPARGSRSTPTRPAGGRRAASILGIRPEDFEDADVRRARPPRDRGRGRRASRSSAPRRT